MIILFTSRQFITLNLDPSLNEYFIQDRSSELECVQKLKDEMRNLSGHLGNVDFSYRDPVNNFDRSKVKGVVAKLIKLKDSSTMTALEVKMHLLQMISSHDL